MKQWHGQIAYYQVKSINDAILCESNTLAKWKKELGEKVAVASIMVMLNEVVKYFNLGKTMNSFQIGETARLLLQEFYYLKAEDLKIFFERFKTGQTGELYDRIDGQVIMVKLREYCEERMQVSEQIALEAHKSIQEPKEEKYLIKTGKNYVRSCGDDFEEVEKKELATRYTFGVAIKLKEWIVKEYYQTNPKEVSIMDADKRGLFDYLEHNKPELLPQGERFKRATNEYYTMKQKIQADESLDSFQKGNAIRSLAGLEPITIQEYNQQQIVYGFLTTPKQITE